ncbi:MAG: hypothetical protein A2V70_17465 [Planctomycetes bacterium RBG_13_63_9]|nr:MAG: hypothetical protein A2V70_17465 [Planctomycetes bacterium RBG_13_63_9]
MKAWAVEGGLDLVRFFEGLWPEVFEVARMEMEGLARRREDAAERFNEQERRDDGRRVAGSLTDGLDLLRDLLYERVQRDVEKIVGRDSMLAPLSEKKSEPLAKTEIDVFQVAESAAAVVEHAYVGVDVQWYVEWLAALRLGERRSEAKVAERLGQYVSATDDQRRLAFSDVLAWAVPESRRAPLVLFRLLPLSVRIATALAFGDRGGAAEARARQAGFLPGIGDCERCRGVLLENGEQCVVCGNPMWKFDWLESAD